MSPDGWSPSGGPDIAGGGATRRPRSTTRDIERYAGLFAERTKVMRSSAMRDLMALTEREDEDDRDHPEIPAHEQIIRRGPGDDDGTQKILPNRRSGCLVRRAAGR